MIVMLLDLTKKISKSNKASSPKGKGFFFFPQLLTVDVTGLACVNSKVALDSLEHGSKFSIRVVGRPPHRHNDDMRMSSP